MVKKKILALALVMGMAAALLSGCGGNPDYKEAQELMEAGEYYDARKLFMKVEEEGGYKDSAEMVKKAQYAWACQKMDEDESYVIACRNFDELGDYEDSAERAQQCVDKLMEDARKSIYCDVYFGHYEQDGNEENGPERLLWDVLDIEDECLLLSTNKIIKVTFFGDGVDWRDSEVRQWLNDEFYSVAFDSREKAMIQPVLTAKYNDYEENGLPEEVKEEIEAMKADGVDPRYIYDMLDHYKLSSETLISDNVFLLSAEEAEGLYSGEKLRRASPTTDIDPEEEYMAWWTRSVGTDYSLTEEDEGYKGVIKVSKFGYVENGGEDPGEELGIRPVICIMRDGRTGDEPLNLSLFGYDSDRGLDNVAKPAPSKPGSNKCPACNGSGSIRFYYGSSDLEAWLTGHDAYTTGKCPMCNGTGRSSGKK